MLTNPKIWYIIIKLLLLNNISSVAQFGRVLGLGPRCRRFKSCHLDQKRWFFNHRLFLPNFLKVL